ncbi:hypothetical protein HK098_008317 [Nowakowskiella sp. JEL0407]|nr:hypothetical protein HK098_008317 [Nowakowskiella sp. JEL0407]
MSEYYQPCNNLEFHKVVKPFQFSPIERLNLLNVNVGDELQLIGRMTMRPYNHFYCSNTQTFGYVHTDCTIPDFAIYDSPNIFSSHQVVVGSPEEQMIVEFCMSQSPAQTNDPNFFDNQQIGFDQFDPNLSMPADNVLDGYVYNPPIELRHVETVDPNLLSIIPPNEHLSPVPTISSPSINYRSPPQMMLNLNSSPLTSEPEMNKQYIVKTSKRPSSTATPYQKSDSTRSSVTLLAGQKRHCTQPYAQSILDKILPLHQYLVSHKWNSAFFSQSLEQQAEARLTQYAPADQKPWRIWKDATEDDFPDVFKRIKSHCGNKAKNPLIFEMCILFYERWLAGNLSGLLQPHSPIHIETEIVASPTTYEPVNPFAFGISHATTPRLQIRFSGDPLNRNPSLPSKSAKSQALPSKSVKKSKSEPTPKPKYPYVKETLVAKWWTTLDVKAFIDEVEKYKDDEGFDAMALLMDILEPLIGDVTDDDELSSVTESLAKVSLSDDAKKGSELKRSSTVPKNESSGGVKEALLTVKKIRRKVSKVFDTYSRYNQEKKKRQRELENSSIPSIVSYLMAEKTGDLVCEMISSELVTSDAVARHLAVVIKEYEAPETEADEEGQVAQGIRLMMEVLIRNEKFGNEEVQAAR